MILNMAALHNPIRARRTGSFLLADKKWVRRIQLRRLVTALVALAAAM